MQYYWEKFISFWNFQNFLCKIFFIQFYSEFNPIPGRYGQILPTSQLIPRDFPMDASNELRFHVEYFLHPIQADFKKDIEKFEKLKKKEFSSDSKGSLLLKENWKKLKKNIFSLRYHTFSTCIWILHILSFLLLRFSNFLFFAIRFSSMTNFIPQPLAAEKIRRHSFW